MILTGAQILIEELIRHGSTTVFGYPGGAVLDIYDELYKNSHRVKHIISSHEQGASHAADGYARISGRPGVVIATSGPGATNLVTGIANAYLDSVPMIAITGNVAVPLLGKDSFQEVDIVEITQPIVKHNFIVRDVNELEGIINEAYALAENGRKGPVLIDIPKSVQKAKCLYHGDFFPEWSPRRAAYNLDKAKEVIQASQRPYIYCGGGVLASGAEEEVLALSKRLSAPVGLSMMGLTSLPHSWHLNLGMCGMHGRYASTVAQSKADLVIAVGVRFSDRATGDTKEYSKRCSVIHIDIDEAELGKNIPRIIEVCGDAKEILTSLLKDLPEKSNPEWLQTINELKQKEKEAEDGDSAAFSPKNIITAVSRYCKEDTPVATDVGQHQMWVSQYFPFGSPRTLLTSGGLGTMGYGFGAAIGGCVASGRKKTLLFTGDGSFGMNLNELATAVSQKLPILIVVFNNGVLGMVRQWQGMFYSEHYSQTTLARATDFVAVAKAFGGDGKRIYSLEQLNSALESGVWESGPFVLDCFIDKDEKVLPMIPPGGTVNDIILSREVR